MPEGSTAPDTGRMSPNVRDSLLEAAAQLLALSFGQHAEVVAAQIDPAAVAEAWEEVRSGQP